MHGFPIKLQLRQNNVYFMRSTQIKVLLNSLNPSLDGRVLAYKIKTNCANIMANTAIAHVFITKFKTPFDN